MKKDLIRLISGTAAVLCSTMLMTLPVFAANVTVTFVTPDRIVQKTVPQGTNMTYQGPQDINIDGYAFCGWNVPLANVQTDVTAVAVYVPIGNESQSVEACNVYHHLPTGVLSYTTADISIIPEPTRNLKSTPTPMESPCTLSGTETVAKNPVGIPGRTCVVKWYNGSTGELVKSDVVWYGTTLPDPATPCISGYEFVGWSGSWTNITEDRNIMACYYKGNRVYWYDENGKDDGDEWFRYTDGSQEDGKDPIYASGDYVLFKTKGTDMYYRKVKN